MTFEQYKERIKKATTSKQLGKIALDAYNEDNNKSGYVFKDLPLYKAVIKQIQLRITELGITDDL